MCGGAGGAQGGGGGGGGGMGGMGGADQAAFYNQEASRTQQEFDSALKAADRSGTDVPVEEQAAYYQDYYNGIYGVDPQ
jgi:hypothetical protein